MSEYKTLYQKALAGDFEIGNVYENLERCREISAELKLMDVIDPNSKQIGLISELLYRMKNMPELQILDVNLFTDEEPNLLALSRTIKGVKHFAYESELEFRTAHPNTPLIKNWKKAEEGEWCLADDGKIVQVLKKGSFAYKRKKKTPYTRTIIGMFSLKSKLPFSGSVKDEMYRFSKRSGYDVATQGHLTSAKKNFAKYIAHGMEPIEAYQKAFPNTKSIDHAEKRSTLLLKNKTVRQAVDKEIENLMSEVGITKRYLLESTKDIVDKSDSKDNDKLRALETLMKISGLLSTEKKVDSVALIQEFSGFSRDKLKAFEQGILPKTKKQLSE